MSILGKVSKIYDANAFLDGFSKALGGVVKINQGTTSKCTGWLLTDNLVVVPAFGIDEKNHSDRIICQQFCLPNQQISIEAKIIFSMTNQLTMLLQLLSDLPNQALHLERKPTQIDDQVFLLHHPQGEANLSISIGNLINLKKYPSYTKNYKEGYLYYNADTIGGSSGAPIFSANWTVVGIHVGSLAPKLANQGLSMPLLLNSLKISPVWAEIADFHKLVDLSKIQFESIGRSATPVVANPDPTLLQAALYWDFNPADLSEADRAKLEPLVVDPDPATDRWMIKADERQKLFRAAGSLEALQEIQKSQEIKLEDNEGQRVINQILGGAPYNLNQIDEELLPYWLQTVRWFANVIPDLPTPAEVNRIMEKRRVRSRFEQIAGNDFRGRKTELDSLNQWYTDEAIGPLVLWGIGGIGKSSLIARFARSLSVETLLLWLDFDRADLAPDDADSVLNVLVQQASVQLDSFQVPAAEQLDEAGNKVKITWQARGKTLGATLRQAIASAPAPLLVLDGFEVAQYTKEYQEIWKVLELILEELPSIRVIVSGRAPVNELQLGGKNAQIWQLTGMDTLSAEAWLRDHKINGARVLQRVLAIARGIPLVLKLAVHYIETGGKIAKLPSELPKELVEGYLYRRILNRVLTPALKPVARDALILRKISATILDNILNDTIPKDFDANQTFSLLSREMGLITTNPEEAHGIPVIYTDEAGVLSLRPDLRSAVIGILDIQSAKRVHEINRRAANWYARQDLDNDKNAAELIYYRLRLGDINGAAQVWRDDCVRLLNGAEDDLRPTAQAWLRERINSTDPIKDWEATAQNQIKDLIRRGKLKKIRGILKEHAERSDQSPLVLYDAWVRWTMDNDLAGARQVLQEAGEATGVIGRDRAILTALLAVKESQDSEVDAPHDATNRQEADRLLASVDDEQKWIDRPEGASEVLAVRAARIRLTVDLNAEYRLTQDIKFHYRADPPEDLKKYLMKSDVILPSLQHILADSNPNPEIVNFDSIPVPLQQAELDNFSFQLENNRRASLKPTFSAALSLKSNLSSQQSLWSVKQLRLVEPEDPLPLWDLANVANLMVLAWRRWRLATANLFIGQACQPVITNPSTINPLLLSIVATLGAFSGQEMTLPNANNPFQKALINPTDFNRKDSYATLNDLLAGCWRNYMDQYRDFSSTFNFALLRNILRQQLQADHTFTKWLDYLDNLRKEGSPYSSPPKYTPTEPEMIELTDLYPVILYLLGPDPLEMLCCRLLNLPDTYRF